MITITFKTSWLIQIVNWVYSIFIVCILSFFCCCFCFRTTMWKQKKKFKSIIVWLSHRQFCHLCRLLFFSVFSNWLIDWFNKNFNNIFLFWFVLLPWRKWQKYLSLRYKNFLFLDQIDLFFFCWRVQMINLIS